MQAKEQRDHNNKTNGFVLSSLYCINSIGLQNKKNI